MINMKLFAIYNTHLLLIDSLHTHNHFCTWTEFCFIFLIVYCILESWCGVGVGLRETWAGGRRQHVGGGPDHVAELLVPAEAHGEDDEYH